MHDFFRSQADSRRLSTSSLFAMSEAASASAASLEMARRVVGRIVARPHDAVNHDR